MNKLLKQLICTVLALVLIALSEAKKIGHHNKKYFNTEDPSRTKTLPTTAVVDGVATDIFVTLTEGTSSTYTINRAPTIVWVTTTVDNQFQVYPSQFIQTFTRQYNLPINVEVGSVGMGDLKGTFGEVRSYETEYEVAAKGNSQTVEKSLLLTYICISMFIFL